MTNTHTLSSSTCESDYEPKPFQVDLPEHSTCFREANSTVLAHLFDGTVTVINADTARQAKTVEAKRELIAYADRTDLVLAVWPGGYSTDLFILRDRRAALEALGLRRKMIWPSIVDADGYEWVTT